MSEKKDTKQEALDFFESNANIKEVFGTTDGFIFQKKGDAFNHAKALNADNPEVEDFTNDGEIEKPASDAAKTNEPAKTETSKPKLTVAEYKELKEKATAEYKKIFGTEPDNKLSGVKIQELNDAKKAELADAKH